jgi:hypothetical protein
MPGTLADIRDAMRDFAARFDASHATASEAERVVMVSAAIEAAAAAVKALAAARVAASGRWQRAGARSAAHALARATGSTIGEAMRTLDTGRLLPTQPAVLAAATAGELSPAQAAAIADAAACRPASTQRLLDLAPKRSLAELRAECRTVKAAGDTGAEARWRRIHAARSLRHWTGDDGTAHLHFTGTPDRVALILAGIAPARERLFARARRAGRWQRAEALAADALVETVAGTGEGSRRGRAAASILVRVDWDSLLRGYPIEGEVCEIAGHGPVPVSAVRDMVGSGDPFLAAIATRGERVVGVAHLRRRPTAHQRTALLWQDPVCPVEGCSRHVGLEQDHRAPWADTKITLLDLMDRLCRPHHALKTRRGWSLIAGSGKRAFVSPDDPRHPRNANPAVMSSGP